MIGQRLFSDEVSLVEIIERCCRDYRGQNGDEEGGEIIEGNDKWQTLILPYLCDTSVQIDIILVNSTQFTFNL